MDYSFTHTENKISNILFKTDNPELMALFLFNHGYYKNNNNDGSFFDLYFQEDRLSESSLDRWIEKILPESPKQISIQERFQQKTIGKFLVKLKVIDPWFIKYKSQVEQYQEKKMKI